MERKIAVVLNSPEPIGDIEEEVVLCADGGYRWVVGAQKKIFIVGDMDSLGYTPEKDVLLCPVDKDYTDGEKAVRLAHQKGVRRIVIYGAKGGRMSMQTANIVLLGIAYRLGMTAEIKNGTERIFYTESDFSEKCPIGTTVSVLPYGGETEFVSSEGLLYPLNGLTLTPFDTVGVSNKTVSETFSLSVKRGGAVIYIEN